MDHIVKMNKLQIVHTWGSMELVERWKEIQRDDNRSLSFTVFTEQVIIPPNILNPNESGSNLKVKKIVFIVLIGRGDIE